MNKETVLWIIAVIFTILSVYYQRVTGPTYPIKGKVTISDELVKYSLDRSHSSSSPLKIQIEVRNQEVRGNVYWKRLKTSDEWKVVKMVRDADKLIAEIPAQPPAGKIEYSIELFYKGGSILIPSDELVVLRFKGDVPAYLLIPHIIFIFFAMVFSTRSGLEYFNNVKNYHKFTNLTIVFLILGGFIFGPLVQYYAFGKLWSGIPIGYDLTDNKTLIALIFWLIAFFKLKKSTNYEKWILIAAIVMFVIFLIPHSLLGSELDYSKLNQ